MDERSRKRFDDLLEEVLQQMPPMVHELIDRVPIHVEDYPSREVMDRMGIRYREQLCGLYTGIPIGEKSIWHAVTMPDVVTIYREGILAAASDPSGRIRRGRLRREIRITLLHELGHHHGLDEDELRRLGYG